MRIRAVNYISTIILLLSLGGLIAGVVLAMNASGAFAGQDTVITLLLALVFAVCHHFIHIILHELGHLFAGLGSGFKPYSFSIGPFVIAKGRVKFVLKNQYGACVMIPKTGENFYRRTFSYLIGGTIVSLILFAASGVFLFVPMGLTPTAYLFLGVGFAVHGYLFLKNLLPYTNVNGESDGAKMLGILKKTPAMQVNLKLFSIQCLLIAGVRPREIDKALLFDIPVLADNSTERILMEDYRYLHYLDSGDAESAVKSSDFIEEFLGDVSDFYYLSLLTDVYYVTLKYKREYERAEKMYAEIYPFIKAERNIVNLRVRMCHELYEEKQPKFAAQTGQDALSLGDRFIIQGVVPLERQLIEEMLADAGQMREKERDELLKSCKITENNFTEYRG